MSEERKTIQNKQKNSRRSVAGMLLAASLLCTGTAPFLASKAVFAAKAAPAITMEQTGYTLVVGKRIQLQADIDDRFASKKLVYKSSKKEVVSVNQSGYIRAKKEGTAVVTVSIQGTDEKASCEIRVVKKSAYKKNAEDVAILKKIFKAEPNALISSDLDHTSQYTWTNTGKEYRLTRICWQDAGLTGELSFAGLTELAELDCSGGQLTSLDVSQNPALKVLNCDNNLLSALDVSKNPALTVLG